MGRRTIALSVFVARLLAAGAAILLLPALGGAARPRALPLPPVGAPVVVLAVPVRDSMDAIWQRGNRHWDELAGVAQISQMLGTGRPTQLEYMGCLRGRASGDTIFVTATEPARGMRRFQFGVTGTCGHLPDVVGTWHTHPFKADTAGQPIKARALSPTDLATFAREADRAVLVVWDVDSMDTAVRGTNGAVRHPAPLVVRGLDGGRASAP